MTATSLRVERRNGLLGTATMILLAIILVVGTAGIIFSSQVQQWLHPGSRLGFFEERIAHIPAEFLRRSPLFAASWETFKICSQIKECDSAGALSMRDQAIKLGWPDIFDRLMVEQDWGERSDTKIAHEIFLDAVERWGIDKLRNGCVPIIRFSTVSNGRNSPMYDIADFSCS